MARKQSAAKRPKVAKNESQNLPKDVPSVPMESAAAQVETATAPDVKMLPLLELAQLVKQSEEAVLANVPVPRIAKILSLGFQGLANRVDGMEEGRLVVPGMGVFVVRKIEVEKDGAKSELKRIILHRPVAKS